MVEIPTTQPGDDRRRLGFAATVSEEFCFLRSLGFELVELSDTFARYESDRRCVRVFHGRSSYELGVEIGRWIDAGGISREQVFPLRDVIALRTDPGLVGYGGTTATSAKSVRRFVAQLSRWTREFAVPLLTNGDDAFEALSARNAAQGLAARDARRASQL
jgi:hypothetical protein